MLFQSDVPLKSEKVLVPRAYTEDERKVIKQRLIESAKTRFTQFGLRKTSIDELVRDVAIGKGSFYQFFDSKEALFFEILEQIETESKSALTQICQSDENSEKMVREFYFSISNHLSRNPFLQVLTDREEFEYLLRNVSPGVLAEHQKEDQAFYFKIFRRWIRNKKVRQVNEKTLMGFVTALFLLHQRQAELADAFDSTIELLIESVCQYVAQ